MKKQTRRKFLSNLGKGTLALMGGKFLYNEGKELVDKVRMDNLYNNAPYYVYKAVHKVTYKPYDKKPEMTRVMKGNGIVIDDYFLTPRHQTTMDNLTIRTGFGVLHLPANVKNVESTLGKKKLESILDDNISDIAVFKINGKHNYVEFPYKPSNQIKVGDKVYLIGDPILSGPNIREGRISDIDGISEKYIGNTQTLYCFGVDTPAIPGDSGTPVVNDRFELVGITQSCFGNTLAYVTKIKHYLKPIEKHKKLPEKKYLH